MKAIYHTLFGFTLSSIVFAQPSKVWNQGNPTNDEQYALEVINRVRSNPVAAVDFYVALSAGKPALATVIAQHQGGAAGIRSRIAADVASYPSAADGRANVRAVPPVAFGPVKAGAVSPMTPGTGRLLVRGVGPTLGALGVAGALTASAADLYDGRGQIIAGNDSWRLASWSDQSAVLSHSAGAFMLSPDSNDSVILVTIPPGSYSAAIRSSSGAPGIGLAEIYEVP